MTDGARRAVARTAAAVVVAAGLAACGGSGAGVVGPAGGKVTAAGVTVTVPAGALSRETELVISELPRGAGEGRRVRIGPDDVTLSRPVTVSMSSDDGDASDERMVEIEHGPEGEIEHGLETERHDEVEHEREAEVEHLGELELRHARICEPGCGAGFECDDGTCKPHPEDPITAPAPTACPDGMELDATELVCKPHGGSGSGA